MSEDAFPVLDPNEAIAGPVNGYYIAAYACPIGGSVREEYAPSFKLFASPPASYFDSGCLLKARPRLVTNNIPRALFLAITHAEELIAGMPPRTSPFASTQPMPIG